MSGLHSLLKSTQPKRLKQRPWLRWKAASQRIHRVLENPPTHTQRARRSHNPIPMLVCPVYLLNRPDVMSPPVWCVSVPDVGDPDQQVMYSTWKAVLHAFRKEAVDIAVVGSLGARSYTNTKERGPVLRACASAFQRAWQDYTHTLMNVVVVLSAVEHHHWVQSIQTEPMGVHFVVEDWDLLAVAHHLAGWQSGRGKRYSVGILNPTSTEALTKGTLGRNWQTGTLVDNEEILAVETTLLLHDRTHQPKLW